MVTVAKKKQIAYRHKRNKRRLEFGVSAGCYALTSASVSYLSDYFKIVSDLIGSLPSFFGISNCW